MELALHMKAFRATDVISVSPSLRTEIDFTKGKKTNKKCQLINKYKNKATSNKPLPEEKQTARLVIPNRFHEGKFSSLTTTQENLKPAGI